MPPFDREAALKIGRKGAPPGQDRGRHRRIRPHRRGAAARLEQRQRARRSVRARQAARQGHRAVHPHRRPPRRRRLLSQGGGALQEDPQVQARRRAGAPASPARWRPSRGCWPTPRRRSAPSPTGAARAATRRAPPRSASASARSTPTISRRGWARRARRSRSATRRPRSSEFRDVARAYDKQGEAGAALTAFESAFELDATDERGPHAAARAAISRPATSARRAASPPASAELKRVVAALELRRPQPTTCSTCSARLPSSIRPTCRCAPISRIAYFARKEIRPRARLPDAADVRQPGAALADARRDRAGGGRHRRRPCRRRPGARGRRRRARRGHRPRQPPDRAVAGGRLSVPRRGGRGRARPERLLRRRRRAATSSSRACRITSSR